MGDLAGEAGRQPGGLPRHTVPDQHQCLCVVWCPGGVCCAWCLGRTEDIATKKIKCRAAPRSPNSGFLGGREAMARRRRQGLLCCSSRSRRNSARNYGGSAVAFLRRGGCPALGQGSCPLRATSWSWSWCASATDCGRRGGDFARRGSDRGVPMPQIMKVFGEFWDKLLTCLLLRIVRGLSAENCGGSAVQFLDKVVDCALWCCHWCQGRRWRACWELWSSSFSSRVLLTCLLGVGAGCWRVLLGIKGVGDVLAGRCWRARCCVDKVVLVPVVQVDVEQIVAACHRSWRKSWRWFFRESSSWTKLLTCPLLCSALTRWSKSLLCRSTGRRGSAVQSTEKGSSVAVGTGVRGGYDAFFRARPPWTWCLRALTAVSARHRFSVS